jgi:hypothetical protein
MVGKVEILEQQMRDHAWSPLAAQINGWRYAGPLEVVSVIKGLCSGFRLKKKPQECEDLQYTRYTFDKVRIVRNISGVGFLSATVLLVFLVAAIVSIIFVYVRYLKKIMRSSVREEVMLEVTHTRYQTIDYAALE